MENVKWWSLLAKQSYSPGLGELSAKRVRSARPANCFLGCYTTMQFKRSSVDSHSTKTPGCSVLNTTAVFVYFFQFNLNWRIVSKELQF